jgi:hypothetical protein
MGSVWTGGACLGREWGRDFVEGGWRWFFHLLHLPKRQRFYYSVKVIELN